MSLNFSKKFFGAFENCKNTVLLFQTVTWLDNDAGAVTASRKGESTSFILFQTLLLGKTSRW